MTLQVGQRWVADTDSSLGLGMITEFDRRKVTIEFPATGEVRVYGLSNSPLTRVLFTPGDRIETLAGDQYEVESVEQVNNLAVYLTVGGGVVPETQLSATIELQHPVKRLLANQLDKPYWFDFRSQLLEEYQRWAQSSSIGLLGARILLTPHQLYVATQATSVMPVRVLLADEVGLGKTIEAGLILHRLMLQHQVQRVLVIVPDALQVQWFVELLRRFCIQANLYDEDLDTSEAGVVIATHSLLEQESPVFDQQWHCVIVDEAHHFDLNKPSLASENLHALAALSEHLLLLSATPERMGLESHFHRLRLLDDNRFTDFNAFTEQLKHYGELANQLAHIEAGQELPQSVRDYVAKQFPNESIDDLDNAAMVELLVDCYGTGRSVFRNTRSSIKGFPKRQLIVHPSVANHEEKYAWLESYLKEHSGEKTLLITHALNDVLEIKAWLYQKTGRDCPVFHEQMTLVERDRAAAYFADQESGAPLMLCSEIGSEGRNFQFCHHLICWDLPDHPDVLEQRIGRLDRIGQTETIKIHLCPEEGEVLAQRLHWYHEVLNCIEQANPAAGRIHELFFNDFCHDPQVAEPAKLQMQALLADLESGRDRLLELNSCPPEKARQWVEQVREDERAHNPQALVEQAVDLLNLHYEQLDYSRFSLIPSDQMLLPSLTGVPLEGFELTFDRDTALAREDVTLMTWDHPFLQGLVDLMNQTPLGCASIALFPIKQLPPGKLLIETLFSLTIQSPDGAEASLFLPKTSLRVLVLEKADKNLSQVLTNEALSQVIEPAPKDICQTIVRDYRKTIEESIKQTQLLAEKEQAGIIEQALVALNARHKVEHTRLSTLQRRFGHVSNEAIEELDQRYQAMSKALSEHCHPEMSVVRVLVTYKPED